MAEQIKYKGENVNHRSGSHRLISIVSPEFLLHEASGWRLEILDADEKRVAKLRLHAPESVTPEI
jgi:hypothetical protein